MTYPNGSSAFADLNPSPEELEDLYEVLGEVQAEGDAGLLGDPPDDGEDYGPWDDETQLSNIYGLNEPDRFEVYELTEPGDVELAGDFASVGELVDGQLATEQQHIAEDLEDRLARRPKFEDKISRALRRIESSTFTPGSQYARDACGQFADHGCGRWTTTGTARPATTRPPASRRSSPAQPHRTPRWWSAGTPRCAAVHLPLLSRCWPTPWTRRRPARPTCPPTARCAASSASAADMGGRHNHSRVGKRERMARAHARKLARQLRRAWRAEQATQQPQHPQPGVGQAG